MPDPLARLVFRMPRCDPEDEGVRRMTEAYDEYPPSAALAHVARTVWVHKTGEQPGYVHRHLPTGGVELHVPLGGRPRLLGPLTRYRLEPLPARSVIVGVRFFPAAAPPLPVGLDELVDQRIDLADLWGPASDRLAEAMSRTTDTTQAIATLERFLLHRFRSAQGPDHRVRAAASALMPWNPVDVGAVAAQVSLSESQLRRRALQAVGVGPKALQRTLRFQGFLALAQAGLGATGRPGAEGISGLAVDAGFADQAHLNRECLRLTGLTPRQLLHGDLERCACGHDHSASYLPFLADRARNRR